ncbi:MAG: hypothetical protein OEW19_08625 [Acidobacteriota bacterium]|nr:hypothetical protein [Acidobacteriota bacterium]
MNAPLHGRLDLVVADLRRVFADRLEAVVAYGRPAPEWSHSLALVASLTMDDLTALAAVAPGWHHTGAATPLVLPRLEFARSLDAFPVEYGEIIDTHAVLFGEDPFAGVSIDRQDLRRAVEVQAASHLLHLRENYVESGGRPSAVGALVRDSAPAFAQLLRRMAHLDNAPADSAAALSHWAAARIGLDARVVGDMLALASDGLPAVDATRLFPDYLQAVTALRHFIDQWSVD